MFVEPVLVPGVAPKYAVLPSLLVKLTSKPVAGAADASFSVPVTMPLTPPTTVLGFSDKLIVTPSICNCCVIEIDGPLEAVMPAVVVAEITLVSIVKFAVVAP
jgi:hypothetical protein